MGGWYSSKHVNADFGLLADFLMDRRGRPGASASLVLGGERRVGGPAADLAHSHGGLS